MKRKSPNEQAESTYDELMRLHPDLMRAEDDAFVDQERGHAHATRLLRTGDLLRSPETGVETVKKLWRFFSKP